MIVEEYTWIGILILVIMNLVGNIWICKKLDFIHNQLIEIKKKIELNGK